MPGLETTPLREQGGPIDEHGCRILSTPSVEYLDGAEQRLYDIFSATEDLRSTSDRLVEQARTWPELYHLSPARANILRPLDLGRDARVLEIGAGCGAITRYLGEQCGLVDAIEPVAARAKVARARTRDLPGVDIFVGDIFDVPAGPTYDAVIVVGVLEYTASGSADLAPYLTFLRQAGALLSDGGTLVVAIENRIGVKYLAGAPEDHTNRPFDSLEGYQHGTPARTFARNELEAMVREVGLAPEVLGAFPDYKLARMLFSDRLFDADPSLAYRIPQFPSPDWAANVDRVTDEGMVWRTMIEAGLGSQTPNSFVVLGRRAEATDGGLWPEPLLAAYYAVGRRARYASETRVVHEHGSIIFDRHLLSIEDQGSGGDHEVARDDPVQLRLDTTPWVAGTDLLLLLSQADDAELATWVTRWKELLAASLVDGEPAPVDLLPHNLIVLPDGSIAPIDSKFTQLGVDQNALLARGALVSGQRLSMMTSPDRWGAFTVEGIVRHLGTLAGLPPDGSWIPAAVAWEAAFQAHVSVVTPEPSTRAEAAQIVENDLWTILHRPLVSTRQLGSGVDNRAALEAELGRMGGAYRTLVDSQYSLTGAHHKLIDQYAAETAELERQLASERAEVTRTQVVLNGTSAELDRTRAEADGAHAAIVLRDTELDRVRAELDLTRSQVDALQTSASWKLTRPIRAVVGLVRSPSS